ncbi:nucleophile aminohydrolase [Trametes elegans]|nr:nucleophile aminohydrolase [Trametes elegans]
MENEGCFNAGFGSNLTISGTVECDASLMDGRTGDYGAVGAVPGVKNPIHLARAVLQHSRLPDPLGRIPPLLLVSVGATDFASTRGMACTPESMVSSRARCQWENWKGVLDGAQASSVARHYTLAAEAAAGRSLQTDGLHDRQDTVGAVSLDAAGNLAAGVSSGGLLLKLPGRVGEAAIYGAGCWATQRTACSVSGAGEYIARANLARTICEATESAGEDEDTHAILEKILGERFHKLCSECGETSPQAGVILVEKEIDDDGRVKPRLWCAFTTESMAIGYATGPSTKPRATILRRPAHPSGNGHSVYIAALPLDR